MALEFYKIIEQYARSQPDHPAVIEAQGTVTYRQLLEQVEGFAGELDSLGLTADSKLGIMGLNQRETLVATLAGFLKGIPVVPYNYMLTPGDLVYITQDAEVDLLVLNPAFLKEETRPFFAQFRHRILTGPRHDHGLPTETTRFSMSSSPRATGNGHSTGINAPKAFRT